MITKVYPISSLLFCFIFMGCIGRNASKTTDYLEEDKKLDSIQQAIKVEKLNPFIKDFRWNPKDNKGVQIWFREDKLCYLHSVHCLYTFPVNYFGDEVIMYWDAKMDCRYDAKFKDSFGGLTAPEVGDAFAKYTLVKTNVISVEYYFSEWVSAYIESESSEEYIHFPDTFYYQMD
ncbi:hypothetical protein PPO43_00565 [Saprospira sp. CCB-QB6]|uniref:hypothetical protein n=1 Tax=Saprospira sp. CCB-QB6 TaxID=3023936 RepID=UPI002349C7F3|nr:hypothetical protein [Saprospira sp. CCB-QB6]WCL81587.1 hypothetical protein PPO43_00565 [Saprospira sp. CCB-QB6]